MSTAPLNHSVERPHGDDIVVLRGATWADYQRMLEIRGERSRPRFAYLEGALEIRSPSREHEHIKSVIGCLVEVFCLHAEIDFSPLGAWTLEDKRLSRGVEPDECYVFSDDEDPTRPDLAIEVVWTSEGLNKLEIYRKLGVAEVWFWQKGQLTLHALRGDEYVSIEVSEALPTLDMELLIHHLTVRPVSRAMREFRTALEAA